MFFLTEKELSKLLDKAFMNGYNCGYELGKIAASESDHKKKETKGERYETYNCS